MARRKAFLAALSMVLVWGSATILLAQSTGTVTGTVSDATGAVIPGVEVTAENLKTGDIRTSVSTVAGVYRITNLPPGEYILRASLSGFKTTISEQFRLTVGQTIGMDLALEVGEVNELITVTGAAPGVNVEQGRVSAMVESEQILDLPLNGRNVYSLMYTAPGVTNVLATVDEPGADASVNGNRANFNGYWLDGVSSRGLSGETTILPNVDSVQEFRIETLNFSAEYGSAAGSVVNVVSKTGTNDFHGSLWEFHRNERLDAREFFDDDKVGYKRNQYGFTFGGPIRKNSTFFFGSYEGLKLRTGESAVQTFESAHWRDFVIKTNPRSVGAFLYRNYPAPALASNAISVGTFLENSKYASSESQAAVDEFAASQFGAPAGLLKADQPIAGEASYFVPDSIDGDQFSIRIDQEFGNNDKFFARYYFDNNDQLQLAQREAFNSPQVVKAHQAALSETHIFSPTVINEVRGGLNRYVNDIIAGTPGVPYIVDGTYGMQFGAYNGYPQIFHENVFDVSDVLSINRGKHGIRAGVQYRRNQENSEFNVGRPSYLFFDMVYIGLDLPYYQFGGVDPHIVDGTKKAELASNFRGWRNSEVGLFFNDDYKITPNLTFNLGLRWDYYSRLEEVQDRATKFDVTPGNGNIFLGVAKGDFARTDVLSGNDWNNLAPRFGFAWDPLGDAKMSIRGGYGIAYQSGIYNPLANSRWNPPFYSFNLICADWLCGRPNQVVLYGPQNGEAVRPNGVNPNPGGRLFHGNIIAYEPTNANSNFLTGIPNPNMRDPYIQSFFFGVQRELQRNLTLEVNYVGTLGRKIIRAENFNRFTGDYLGKASPTGEFGGDSTLNRVNPRYGNLRFWENSVNSNYNALQVQLQRRYSNGLAFGANYTLAKSMDIRSTWHSGATTSNFGQEGFSTDVLDVHLDYGRSIFDARHNFSVNGIWELPFFRNSDQAAARWILGGWQFNWNAHLQSGQPFTPHSSLSFFAGGDFNGDAVRNDRPHTPSVGNSFSNVERSAWVNPGAGPFGVSSANQNKVPSLAEKMAFFGIPAPGTNGNLGRNTYEGPGFAGTDLSFFKHFPLPIREDMRLQFRFEMFNVFNRVNFLQPESRLNQTTFGRAIETFDAREIQLALKILF